MTYFYYNLSQIKVDKAPGANESVPKLLKEETNEINLNLTRAST